jgi:hypothetical protein
MMRALALVPAVLLLACGKPTQVDLTQSGTVTVKGAPGGAPLPPGAFTGLDLTLNRSVLDQQGIDTSRVASAELVGFRISVLSGAALTSWLDSAAFYVEAPGVPRKLLGQKTGIRSLDPRSAFVDLESSALDLMPYLLAASTTVTAEGSGIQPDADTTVQATATIQVGVSAQ